MIEALAGGLMIGAAAALLLLGSGQIAGVSGILEGALGRPSWRWTFLAGLVCGGLALALLRPQAIGAPPASLAWLAIAGFLVGVGTRLGSGCTSGHGVCGVSRLSTRSVVATGTFIATGMITVFLMGRLT
jgi:hypothetical protein